MATQSGDGGAATSSPATAAATVGAPTDPTTKQQTEPKAKDKGNDKDKKAEKERQKALKAEKLARKQAKAAGLQAATTKVESKKKAETLPAYVEKTPAGEKKILGDLADAHHSAYHPLAVESAWYAWWEKSGFFQPRFDDAGKKLPPGAFVIPIPPPNVTGALHCGHALGTALQDVLIRWHRMRGFTTLFVPGCDHASISTQSVIENMLWRKERTTRHDLGREKFIERALEWKNDYHGRINRVLRRLGGSFDWTREAFTMDPQLTEAALEAFVKLHEEGFIYRENKFVNWSVKLNTTISNLEVETKELSGRTVLDVPGYERKVEFGVLTYFKYPIEDSDETIEIATTRLETMLGDTAVAVYPDDERFKHLVGKFVRHPFLERRLPIIADTYVEKDFGTGAVKITPAHDQNDFAMGARHNLPSINILNDNGTMNENAGKYQGQKRYDVRYALCEELTKLGLFVKKENNPMVIRLCAKSKDVIEPLLKPQWWVRMKGLAEPALDAVRNGEIKIRPEASEKSYFRWLENINDWCLSRQLWWGQRIPAYYVRFVGDADGKEVSDRWIVAKSAAEAKEKATAKFPNQEFTLEQDPDVFDTWFSSGLWPFATLGWPKNTLDFQELFPTSVLETGWDILFFWVARMIMLSLKLTGKVPFKEVYTHSLIRDAQGRKMSKSLGNVIDPVDVIDGITLEALQEKLKLGNLDEKEYATASKNQKESFPQGIPECGTDALRFSLVNYTTGGGDINFDIKQMAGYRRFCNKIYQATKYVLGKLPNDYVPPRTAAKTGKETLPERWILHQLNSTARNIHAALDAREFSRASQIIYQYWLDSLCDVYIENSKVIISDGTPEEQRSAIDTLYSAVEAGLTMMHPFMPFITEELWQRLPRREGDATPSIIVAAYPSYREDFCDEEAAQKYGLLLACSRGLRSLAAEYGVKLGGNGFIVARDAEQHDLIEAETAQIKALATKAIASITICNDTDAVPLGSAVYTVSSTVTVFLGVASTVDASLITKSKEKLAKAVESAEKQRKLIESADWQEHTSAAIREQEYAKLAAAEAAADNLKETIAQFEKLDIKD
ncbi:valyl-tRNA synthetase [Biscogniauxia marginata]|nr:valyl-tRNA synthetase [Biscogniauxia marginata]